MTSFCLKIDIPGVFKPQDINIRVVGSFIFIEARKTTGEAGIDLCKHKFKTMRCLPKTLGLAFRLRAHLHKNILTISDTPNEPPNLSIDLRFHSQPADLPTFAWIEPKSSIPFSLALKMLNETNM